MSNKNKLHVRYVIGSKEQNYIAERVEGEAEVRKRFEGCEEDYLAKIDFAGFYRTGEIYFYKRARKQECIVLPKQIENPVTKVMQDYPYIEDKNGLRVAVAYPGTTTAGYLYGEYVADPGDAVTMVHVSQMMTKNVKKIHGTAKFPVAVALIGLAIVVIVLIVVKMSCSKAPVETPVNNQSVIELLLSEVRL